MSFVVAAALAIAALVALPVLAHLLRRSRAQEVEFPPTHLVPKAQPVARQRRRIEDRALLSVRALLIVVLALLGATPLVQCSRLSLDRNAGASVAMAIVLDDSLSMFAKTQGNTRRWDLALSGARELLSSARQGDAAAIILAGAPPRLLLAATTDLSQASRVLGEASPSDRDTDLAGAIKMARSALEQLPHTDRRVVVLSDLAGDPLPEGTPPVTAPLTALTAPVADCGVVMAERRGKRVSVTVACNAAEAARDRRLEVVTARGAGTEKSEPGKVVGEAALELRGGAQILSIEIPEDSDSLDVRLTGSDALPEDDTAAVAPEAASLTVALVRDPATTSVSTGGATIVEQAIASLERDVIVRPLTVLPDEPKALAPIALLIIDDPPGLVADARAALSDWLRRGGVAVALLGPRVEATQLGSTLEPFVSGATRWQKTQAKGADAPSLGWMGLAAESLGALDARGRVALSGALPAGARVVGRWDDGEPFIAEVSIGRGLALITSLPASVDQSDLALRPGFLALLSHALDEAERRAGPRRSQVGDSWSFGADAQVDIEGPVGKLTPTESPGATAQKLVNVGRAGRHEVVLDGEAHTRFVHRTEGEITRLPRSPEDQAAPGTGALVQSRVDLSRNLAMLALALLALELWLRFLRRPRKVVQERRVPTPTA